MLRRRSVVLACDTAVVAATNALVLILAARLLQPTDLSSLTMIQLLVVTAVGLQRATLLSPALAAQRSTGSAAIPLRWLLLVSLPGSVVAALLIPLLVPGEMLYADLVVLSFIGVAPALAQDVARFCLFSRGRPTSALASDSVWLVGFVVLAFAFGSLGRCSWQLLVTQWGSAGLIAMIAATVLVVAPAAPATPIRYVSIKDAWRLGKWSGSDAALSGAANLIPMVVSTLALGSPVAAIYRLLQVANGPFNIISATFITSAGMDSWKLGDANAVRALRRRAHRQSVMLAVLALVFYAAAFPCILLVSNVGGTDAMRVSLILGASGILGAATIPINAAATAMGYQRVGFIIRVFVVGSAIAVSAAATAAWWIPWSDPVGVVAIVSAVLGYVGWLWGYESGFRREFRRAH